MANMFTNKITVPSFCLILLGPNIIEVPKSITFKEASSAVDSNNIFSGFISLHHTIQLTCELYSSYDNK
jgi:hypothetical protein